MVENDNNSGVPIGGQLPKLARRLRSTKTPNKVVGCAWLFASLCLAVASLGSLVFAGVCSHFMHREGEIGALIFAIWPAVIAGIVAAVLALWALLHSAIRFSAHPVVQVVWTIIHAIWIVGYWVVLLAALGMSMPH